ncbi:OmpW/AlkL family protein [Ideonella livida]|uniref:Outer membrane beta-barrel protein n=1 Tax=Ideonella livida TaxID=2707176 RepID=A0A7C9PF79_9BURK|nr:OmpW family outer membrane protein [Ideonella livida]NDY89930.1 outer membrane beta-barrel protein [Ideonella livida]
MSRTSLSLAGLALLAAAMPLSAAAQALLPSGWSLKLGLNQIAPQLGSGDLSAPSLPGTQVDVRANTQPIFTLTVPLGEHFTVEAFGGLPYTHDIVGDGAIAGSGKIGSTKQVSPTVFGQYRFAAVGSSVRPYLGLGLTYAKFYGEEGSGALTAMTNAGGPPTRLSIDAAWGLSAQLGVTLALGERWFLDAALVQTKLKTTTHLSSGQQIDTRLDPRSTAVAVGYRF